MNEILESDWNLLRRLQPVALERLCDRLLRQIVRECQRKGTPLHEKFLRAYSVSQDGDRRIARAFDDLRRSTALVKLAIMKDGGLITDSELSQFSEETRKRLALFSREDA